MNEIERHSNELLRGTPMRTESRREQEAREDAHRAIAPYERQPYMIVFMGMMDFGVLWIGPEGQEGDDPLDNRTRLRHAEVELERWKDRIKEGMWMLPFTRDPHPSDLQIRQQWDIDGLTDAIHRGYER